jgi:hypothetical protein
MLTQPEDELERLSSAFRFHHRIADEFSSALKKNAGKALSVSFDMHASPMLVGTLFGSTYPHTFIP